MAALKYSALFPDTEHGDLCRPDQLTGLFVVGEDTSGRRPDHKPRMVVNWRDDDGKRRQRTLDLTRFMVWL